MMGLVQDPFANVLRYMVARYILDNHTHSQVFKDEYRCDSIETYCQELSLMYHPDARMSSALEMEAISELFGVRIEIFDPIAELHVGTYGTEKGVIQPNIVFGKSYAGAPIRLIISHLHFYQIEVKTA